MKNRTVIQNLNFSGKALWAFNPLKRAIIFQFTAQVMIFLIAVHVITIALKKWYVHKTALLDR